MTLVRELGSNPSVEDQTKVTDMRNRLQRKIDGFEQEASRYLPPTFGGRVKPVSIDDHTFDRADYMDEVDVHASESAAPELSPHPHADSEDLPERIVLSLPSSLAYRKKRSDALEALAQREFKLREGQANDALDKVREGVAHRSFLFRTKVREASGHAAITRSRRQVLAVSRSLGRAARLYHMAIEAMQLCSPKSAILAKYRKLTLVDLKADTQKLDFNAAGSRRAHLSWIWGEANQSSDDSVEIVERM